MTTRTEISELEEKTKNIEDRLGESNQFIKYTGIIGTSLSLFGTMYVGLRYIFGGMPKLDIIEHYVLKSTTFTQKLDEIVVGLMIGGICCFAPAALELLGSISTRKDKRKAEGELKRLNEDYNFSRGYD
jgi:hypothetical protein